MGSYLGASRPKVPVASTRQNLYVLVYVKILYLCYAKDFFLISPFGDFIVGLSLLHMHNIFRKESNKNLESNPSILKKMSLSTNNNDKKLKRYGLQERVEQPKLIVYSATDFKRYILRLNRPLLVFYNSLSLVIVYKIKNSDKNLKFVPLYQAKFHIDSTTNYAKSQKKKKKILLLKDRFYKRQYYSNPMHRTMHAHGFHRPNP